MSTCQAGDNWSVCAAKTKQAIKAAGSVPEALNAAEDWSVRYRRMYDASASAQWPPSDMERFEGAMRDLFDEYLGKYLDPASLVLRLAFERYLPRLAAVLGFLESAPLQAIWIVLGPSPIASDFTAARIENEEINRLLIQRLDTVRPPGWREEYGRWVDKALQNSKGKRILP